MTPDLASPGSSEGTDAAAGDGNADEAAEGAAAAGAAEAANAVSLLQEYVQGCAPFTPKAKILKWDFEQQLGEETALQFRATVSFIFHSVPHQFSGGWQSSKKKAQRDTAERVRAYLAKSFDQPTAALPPAPRPPRTPPPASQEGSGDDAAEPAAPGSPASGAAGVGHKAAIDPRCLSEAVVQELWAAFEGRSSSFSSTTASEDGESAASAGKLEWEMEERGADGFYKATVSFKIFTVPHHFKGDWCACADEARRDVAERVLFYFGKRPEAFAVERPRPPPAGEAEAPAMRLVAGPQAPSTPCGDDTAASPSSGAACPPWAPVEEKTILMQVQNALQKSFAKETPPGQRVWVWSYDADPNDQQRFRARVEVPSWGGRIFVGDWCRGKKLAQRSACLEVKRELEPGACGQYLAAPPA